MIIDRELEQLFKDTGAAHHRAFEATAGDDPEWADWYARQLAPQLSARFGLQLDVGALATDLKAVDAEYRLVKSATAWPDYYATWFRDRYNLL